ncbi:hypothetical protein J4Q44_G00123420 [Coregonus suidteri]|uniref:Uncharacterized protein n=1 Tax=Coregonus suidteri TaxID=861788 RepID=A0AAN8R7Y0_9TELE
MQCLNQLWSVTLACCARILACCAGKETQASLERKPNADSRVSSVLWKLSLDDFPEDGERLIKDSREGLSREEDRNDETLFGVSPGSHPGQKEVTQAFCEGGFGLSFGLSKAGV